MTELPLFPLNTVLFPGMPLALHIFEDRYKLMIGKCIQESQPFGVVLIKKGIEALGPTAESHIIGCTARVSHVQRLEQGRMNIEVVGQERFRLLSVSDQLPYLVGQIERYPLEEGDQALQTREANRLRPWLMRYLNLLPLEDEIEIEATNLPDEPLPLAFLAATMLQIPPEQKQPLLAANSALDLLSKLRAMYRQEIALLKHLAEQPKVDQGSFSLN